MLVLVPTSYIFSPVVAKYINISAKISDFLVIIELIYSIHSDDHHISISKFPFLDSLTTHMGVREPAITRCIEPTVHRSEKLKYIYCFF